MTKVWIALAALALISTTAHANTYTYMCRVGQTSYPVKLTTPDEANGSLSGGTITWRNEMFRDVKLGEGCRYNFVATRNGVTVELCTSTHGSATLTIGKDTFDCQMKDKRK